MKTFKIYPSSINDRFISEAAEHLRNGDIIIYPTDSLYAIGCNALNQSAIDRLCRLKGIDPKRNTLSIICADISQASEFAVIDNKAYSVLRRFTPGPFTFILPTLSQLPKAFKGRRQVGIRIPDNAIAVAIAKELGNPLLSTSIPSAGLSDDEFTMPDEIMLRFESDSAISIMIDGGIGNSIPSAIIDLIDSSAPNILRHGPLPFDL